MKLIWKLLKQNISKPQLIGFFAANLVGMVILLLSLQFYFDVNPIFTQKDNLFKKDYFVVTKKLGMISSLAGAKSSFNAQEIEDIKSRDFIKEVGSFTPAQFNVRAGINSPSSGIAFNTDMFFETVPQQFIDVKSDEWTFSPTDNTVPIILPKNYLDLYNFGFAESRSMPKITENLIKMIDFDLTIKGNGSEKQLKGSIVGLSNRLNTILVPESFMNWANKNYGNQEVKEPARLIVEIKDITNPQINSYFKEKGYEIDQGNTSASRLSMFLKIIVSVVAVIGLIICLLSFFVLVLSIYLLLEKNMQKLNNLRLIGYPKKSVARPYILMSAIVNFSTFIFAILAIIIVQLQYSKVLERIFNTYESVGYLNTILMGFGLFALLTGLNTLIINKKIK